MALITPASQLDLRSELVRLCEEVIPSVTLDPAIKIFSVEVDMIATERFGSQEPRTSYIVSVRVNDASMLRGKARSLKGSYKERVEGILDNYAKRSDPSVDVFLEIRGPESNSVERLVPVSDMVRSGKVSALSPIVRTAERNAIPYIQIRGRHLIAPSPAIAEFLEQYARDNSKAIDTAIDLFAGTAVATKTLFRVATPRRVLVVDNDPSKLANWKRHLHDDRAEFLLADAMEYVFQYPTDLVVADPYYEDVEEFLNRQLGNLAKIAKTILLVPGNVEDRLWNARMATLVQQSGYKVSEHTLYGQVILEANRIEQHSKRAVVDPFSRK